MWSARQLSPPLGLINKGANMAKKPTQRPKWNSRNLLISAAILVGGLLALQIFYPSSNLPLGIKINGKNLSAWNKKAAIKELNRAYNSAEIRIFLADSEESFKVVSPEDFGLEVDNTRRLDSIEYPWFMRIVPTSLFWWGLVVEESPPSLEFDDTKLQKFVDKNFGAPCRVEPKNAMLSIDGSNINIEKSNIGGSCYQSIVKDNLKNVKFTSPSEGQARIDLTVERPAINTAAATALAMEVSPNLANDLALEIDEVGDTVTLGREELATWVSFGVVDGQLVPKIDAAKSSEFYKTRVAPLVEQGAGVTTIIATEDLSAVRINGVEGRVINIEETNLRIVEYLLGLRKTVAVAVESTDPSVNYVYSRPQSDQGPAAVDNEPDDSETDDEY
jgi:hypothetical protein